MLTPLSRLLHALPPRCVVRALPPCRVLCVLLLLLRLLLHVMLRLRMLLLMLRLLMLRLLRLLLLWLLLLRLLLWRLLLPIGVLLRCAPPRTVLLRMLHMRKK